jgi:two-component system, OmpR family, sensor histidine kinase CpxA
MRSLFLRLFLWLGLAMVLVNIAAFVIGVVAERRFQPPRNNPLAPMTGLLAQTAVETFEYGGSSALRSYLARLESTSAVHAVLLNDRGEDVAGQPIPEHIRPLAERVSEATPFVFEFSGEGTSLRSPHAAQLVRSPKGSTYTLVARFPPPDFPRPPRLGEPGSLLFGLRVAARTLLPLLLVGGLFCYLLARSLAKPIEQLRNTTHELSDGNLSARVEPTLLKRRDEIGHLGRDFNLMASHIDSLVEAQRRLLADISHELRSPLARQGVALGLARRRGNSEVMPALERIAREANRMNEMIGQLLDLSQFESGTNIISKSRVDLAELVESIVQDADYEARDSDRSVKIVHKENCATYGAVELLGSAIENVLRNAVRHTAPKTEVEVSLKCAINNGLSGAVITVRDHGIGVPEKALKDIFDPFYRVEDARDRKTGGTGLGLAIARRAIGLHGGTIKALNASDGGLQVEISLPQQG